MSKPIKLSDEVAEHLSEMRRPKESFDACLRRQFGLPTRKGEPQGLNHYFLVLTDGDPIAKLTLADARGAAILSSVKRGVKASHRQKHAPVIRVREVPE